jgi:eukaryotic-like serine/threonine-protein kinase
MRSQLLLDLVGPSPSGLRPVRLTPGTRVGPYEVVALLGVGGMAEVYRARDTRLGRDVALKVVSEVIGSSGPVVERFEREARMASALSHPNVVALYDVGLEEGSPYFVTELLRGESLRERLSKGAVPHETALEWAAQTAQGLAAAHASGIVHRDLKPENVFITRDGHVKIIDFGIAKLAEAHREANPRGLMDETLAPSGSETSAGLVLGTPGYMSPEQVHGGAVDARTDLFSLGVVLYEMLSGRRAFPKGPPVETAYAILHSEPEALPDSVPTEAVQTVRRCLEKDPDRRFQSARDLAFQLELLTTPSGWTPKAPLPAIPRTLLRRWRWQLSGLLLAFAVAGLSYLLVRQLRPAIPNVEQVTFRLGRISAARFSPEGRVVYSAAWGGRPLEVFTQPQASRDAQPSGLRDAELLAVSSNGDLAVSLRTSWYGPGRKGTLAVVPSVGGAPRELAEDIAYADWSTSGELAAVRVNGGKRQLEYPLGTVLYETSEKIFNPRLSPDGSLVAFLVDREFGPTQFFVLDKRGRTQTSFDAPGATGLAWAPTGDEVWLSASNGLWAAAASRGQPRRVYQGVSELRLEDISPTGVVLVNSQETRRELAFVPPGEQRERPLSWLDWTHLGAISDDGSKVLFSATPRGDYYAYVRPTDGALPVELGPGFGLAFSPDGNWVLATHADPHQLSLLPLGPGVAKTVPLVGVEALRPRWLRDGKRIVFLGRTSDHDQFRFYVVSLAGGVPKQVSDEAIHCCFFEVSRDDRFVAARSLNDVLTLYPLDGTAPVLLPELGKDAVAVAWDDQQDLWVRSWSGIPSRLRRYDVAARRVLEERMVAPSDTTGLTVIGQICLTPDGRSLAFDYVRTLGSLYRLDGLAPAKH